MAATAGFLSTCKVGSTVINNVKSQDFGAKIAALDTTSFSASTPGTESYIGGLLSGDYKLSGQYDKSDTGQSTIETNFYARTITTFTFAIGNAGANTYAMPCLITDYNVKSDVKGLVTADWSMKLSGAVTIV
jgi:hypothetical protein